MYAIRSYYVHDHAATVGGETGVVVLPGLRQHGRSGPGMRDQDELRGLLSGVDEGSRRRHGILRCFAKRVV